MNTKKGAFTLIELLVVIAIIAILAAILFPVFAQAKKQAKKTVSLSDAKQLALATIMYANDNDDLFPDQNRDVNGFPTPWYAGGDNPCGADNDVNGGCLLGFMDPLSAAGTGQNWGRGDYPYIKSPEMYYDSAQKVTDAVAWAFDTRSGAGNASYVFNGTALGKSQTSISDVANLIVYQGDIQTKRESDVQPTYWSTSQTITNLDGSTSTGPACNGIDINWVGVLFDNMDAYGFADGHAKSMRRAAVNFHNLGVSSSAWQLSASGWNEVSNKTGMIEYPANQNWWPSWGICDLTAL